MSHRDDNYLLVGRFVKNQIWVGRCYNSAHGRKAGEPTATRILRYEIDNRLNAALNAVGALRGLQRDIGEHLFKLGKGGTSVT